MKAGDRRSHRRTPSGSASFARCARSTPLPHFIDPIGCELTTLRSSVTSCRATKVKKVERVAMRQSLVVP